MFILQGERSVCREYYIRNIAGEFFDFRFSYVDEVSGEVFNELNRFLWESKKNCTRFRNRYSGPVMIDITEWADRIPNDYFDAFLYFLKDNESRMSYTFISSRECSENILLRIRSLFNAETLELGERRLTARMTAHIGFHDNEEMEV